MRDIEPSLTNTFDVNLHYCSYTHSHNFRKLDWRQKERRKTNMNKLFTKIAASVLGLSMATGVGVAVASNQPNASPAQADNTSSITITYGGFDGSPAYNSGAEYTGSFSDSESNTITVACKYVMNSSGNMQMQANNANVYNKTATPGRITNITVKQTGTARAFTAYGGTSQLFDSDETGTSKTPSGTSLGSKTAATMSWDIAANTDYTFFAIHKGANAGYVSEITVTYELGSSQSSDWETTAIAISKTNSLAVTIFNTDEEFPSFDDITVTKTEHDNNGVAADIDTDVTESATLHWVYASNGNDVTLPLANGEYSVKIWASVTDETLTSKDNATPAKQYVTGTLTVTDEPQYVTIAYTNTSTTTNMTGNNDAATLGVSATDWSVKGYQGSANNLPGLNKAKQIRLYGNANGGNYICINTLKANRNLVKIDLSTSNSTNFAVYEGDQTTSGTALSGSNGIYTFGEDVTGFTIINTNSGTTQVYILSIKVYYEDESVSTPTLILSNTPSAVGVGNTATFTVEYFALTSAFTVSTNASYVTASYEGATGTGSAVVTLTGVSAIASTTIQVLSTGAETQSFNISVDLLPLINSSLNTMTWGSTTYATSPHTVTWNSSYDFVVSAGQFNSNTGYLGSNSNNAAKTNVSNNDWTLKDSAIDSAIVNDGTASWFSYGQALYMSNFGIIHPTEFTINAANSSSNYTGTYYILASTDSGDTWTVLSSDSIATSTNLSWTGNTYASNPNPIQFAFVTTSTSVGTLSNVTVKAYGGSIATTKILDSIYVSGTPKTSYIAGEAFSLESAKVYAHYTDSTTYPDEDVSSHVSFSTISHGTTEVTITYLNKSTTVNVSVSDAGDVYKKVTSTGELLEGSKVVIGSTSGTSLMGEQASNNRHSESSEVFGYYDSGDVSTHSINTSVFTVGIVEENDEVFYTFKDSENKYLYAVASANNYLRSQATLTDAGKWHVEFDENVEGKALITTSVTYDIESVPTVVTKYMGGNASAYGCYLNTNNAISIYVDVENNVDLFVAGYMHTEIEYDADPELPINNTGNCDSQGWYLAAKRVLVGMGSDYISEFQTNGKYTNALARYSAWALACGDASPFAGDDIVPAQGAKNITELVAGSSNIATIMIVVSLISITAIGGYFLLKKRKEQ